MAYTFVCAGNDAFKEKILLFGCKVIHRGQRELDKSMQHALDAYVTMYRGMQLPFGVFNQKAITKQDNAMLITRCAQRMYDPEIVDNLMEKLSVAMLVERFIADAVYSQIPRNLAPPKMTGLKCGYNAGAAAVIRLYFNKSPAADAVVLVKGCFGKSPAADAEDSTGAAHHDDEEDAPVKPIPSRRPAPMELMMLFNKNAEVGEIRDLLRNNTMAPELTSVSPFDFANMADVVYGLSRYCRHVLQSKMIFHMPEYLPAEVLAYSKDRNGYNIKLGEGVSSAVYLGTVCDRKVPGGRSLVALKCYKKDQEFSLSSFFAEGCYLQKMSGQRTSPHLYGFAMAKDNALFHRLILVTEFIGDGKTLKSTTIESLIEENYDHIERTDERLYNVKFWFEVALAMFECLERLSRLNIATTDIKTDNLIWCAEKSIVYSFDYGLACKFGQSSAYPALEGLRAKQYLDNFPQVAPELVQASIHQVHANTDVYGAGHILERISMYGLIPELDILSRPCRSENADGRLDVYRCIEYLKHELGKMEAC